MVHEYQDKTSWGTLSNVTEKRGTFFSFFVHFCVILSKDAVTTGKKITILVDIVH